MATVAPFLNDMTALAKSRADFLGYAEILSLDAHAIPADRVAAFLKLFQRFGVALPAFFREDHGLLLRGHLVVHMAGHAVDALPGMLRFHPGLKKAGGYSLVTFHAKPRVHLGSFVPRTHAGYPREKKDRTEKDKTEDLKMLSHFLNLSSFTRDATRGSGNLFKFSSHQFFQGRGVIQFFLLGRKKEGDDPFLGFFYDQIPPFFIAFYFFKVLFFKLGPLFRGVTIPFP
jgi:hypothetical protein